MRSIKQRMVLYFMFIIIITVIIFEFFLITSIRQNYYQSLEDSLTASCNLLNCMYATLPTPTGGKYPE